MSDKKEDKNNPSKPSNPDLGEEKKDDGYKFNKESDKPKIGEEEQPSRDEDEKQGLEKDSDKCADDKNECADDGKKDEECH